MTPFSRLIALGAPVTVHTARLGLRPVTPGDVDDLVVLDSDAEVMRYVSEGEATPREVVEDWVIPRAQADHRARLGGLWIISDRHRGVFLGWAGLRAPRHSNRSEMELSYRLRRAVWGCGFATEASRTLLRIAFEEYATDRIFASTMIANGPSRRVMEKIGMRLSGIVPAATGDPALGEVEYDLLRSHWQTVTMRWPATQPQVGSPPGPGLSA